MRGICQICAGRVNPDVHRLQSVVDGTQNQFDEWGQHVPNGASQVVIPREEWLDFIGRVMGH